ncbi:hypothetical protein AYO20_09684 [Fonsecaea nubica]|uniref:Uncharacterized protein n=1 Tax=Fonsecaea nubica TaxID=856822 RepID=A0A178CGJ0_9EURO|nr:hypothetical protein AYO20_09684 [Fonsecaea nubica]OAL27831.1 hypothetical protein AYO20_09684 [Fonsecaea nubica]
MGIAGQNMAEPTWAGGLESKRLRTYLFAFLIPTVIYFLVKALQRPKRRFPNVPWLRLSSKPGKKGEKEDAMKFVENGHKVIMEGADTVQYTRQGLNWMMRTPEGGQFVVHPKFVEELRSAKETDLHNLPANNDLMQTRHTMHKDLEWDQYHFNVVSKQLTHSLGPGLPEIVDECKGAFATEIGHPEDWKSVHMYPTAFNIVTRTANRLLFGKELARDPSFLKMAIEYSECFFGGANMVRHYPEWMKPLVLRFRTGLAQQTAIANEKLIPVLKQRLKDMERAKKENRWAEYEKTKPADTIQWVLDITPPEKMNLKVVTLRLVHILTAAVHTSSVTFLNTMYDLAAHPEVLDELRQEINDVFASENGLWRKQGLTKLVKMDSFIKESARFHPFQAGTMDRIAMRDYTLSDGTFVPKGTYMLTPSSAANLDPDVWGPDAEKFDPWRFQRMRQAPGQETLHSMVQTTPNFTFFGHGKHACPGRFFAVNEIKVLLTYTLVHYDVKYPPNAPTPEMMWFSGKTMPDMKTYLLWKERKDVQLPWNEVS